MTEIAHALIEGEDEKSALLRRRSRPAIPTLKLPVTNNTTDKSSLDESTTERRYNPAQGKLATESVGPLLEDCATLRDLALRYQENKKNLYRFLAEHSPNYIRRYEISGLEFSVTDCPLSFYNTVISWDLTAMAGVTSPAIAVGEKLKPDYATEKQLSAAVATVNSAIAHYRAARVPLRWTTDCLPEESPYRTLSELLRRSGLVQVTGEGAVMVVDLWKQREQLEIWGKRLLPAFLRVREVPPGDTEGVRTWAEVLTQSYGLASMPRNGLTTSEWFSRAYADVPRGEGQPLRLFLGLVNNRAVACATLFCGQGVAGMYTVCTLRDAKGKGVGGAMTSAVMRTALTDGYRWLILEAPPDSLTVYSRLGFSSVPSGRMFMALSPGGGVFSLLEFYHRVFGPTLTPVKLIVAALIALSGFWVVLLVYNWLREAWRRRFVQRWRRRTSQPVM